MRVLCLLFAAYLLKQLATVTARKRKQIQRNRTTWRLLIVCKCLTDFSRPTATLLAALLVLVVLFQVNFQSQAKKLTWSNRVAQNVSRWTEIRNVEHAVMHRCSRIRYSMTLGFSLEAKIFGLEVGLYAESLVVWCCVIVFNHPVSVCRCPKDLDCLGVIFTMWDALHDLPLTLPVAQISEVWTGT